MSETKATRLGKAAKELGVSTGTIIEFLAKKGEKIEDSPMAKIEGTAYEMLLAEFAGDKAAKEKTADTSAKIRESRATITLEDTKKGRTGEKSEEEPEIDYSRFKRKVEVKEKPAPTPAPTPAPIPDPEPEPIAEIPVAEPEPIEEVKPAAKKSAKKKEEEIPVEPAPEERTNEVKVVGKIDLDALEKPKSKGKKKKDEVVEEVATKKKPTKAQEQEKPQVVQAPKPVQEPAPEVIQPKEPEKELDPRESRKTFRCESDGQN
jgi:translation initiation factor IF-2